MALLLKTDRLRPAPCHEMMLHDTHERKRSQRRKRRFRLCSESDPIDILQTEPERPPRSAFRLRQLAISRRIERGKSREEPLRQIASKEFVTHHDVEMFRCQTKRGRRLARQPHIRSRL